MLGSLVALLRTAAIMEVPGLGSTTAKPSNFQPEFFRYVLYKYLYFQTFGQLSGKLCGNMCCDKPRKNLNTGMLLLLHNFNTAAV